MIEHLVTYAIRYKKDNGFFFCTKSQGTNKRKDTLNKFIRSHFGSSHFLLERARCFSSSRAFWFCLVQVSTTQFCSFPFLMARVSDGTNVPISPAPASSSNLGSPNGSLPDLEGVGGHPTNTMEETFEAMLTKKTCPVRGPFADLKTVSCLLHNQWHLSQTKFRTLNSLLTVAARVTTLETNATSVSSCSGSARSWNVLGHSDGSTATGSLGSHGLGSSDDNRNTRRRLDTFSSPEDEQARSAILLQFLCEQFLQKGYEMDQLSLGRLQYASIQQTCQNSLQSCFCGGQACI